MISDCGRTFAGTKWIMLPPIGTGSVILSIVVRVEEQFEQPNSRYLKVEGLRAVWQISPRGYYNRLQSTVIHLSIASRG